MEARGGTVGRLAENWLASSGGREQTQSCQGAEGIRAATSFRTRVEGDIVEADEATKQETPSYRAQCRQRKEYGGETKDRVQDGVVVFRKEGWIMDATRKTIRYITLTRYMYIRL